MCMNSFDREKNRITKRNFVVVVVTFALLTVFFCLAAIFSSFGYKQSLFASKDETTREAERVTVVIDAGHGGEDSGAVANGLVEKELNLEVAKKLEAMLQMSDVDVVMTRSEDVLLSDGATERKKLHDLLTRVKIAKQYDKCIFISIHMNKFPLEECHGLQVFYSENNEKSRSLAETLRAYALQTDDKNGRVIKPSGKNIYVLDRLECPAVLVECCFLSNSYDASRITDEKEQTKLAFALFCGINKFIEEQEKESG